MSQKLLLMAIASFAAMYALMYLMVDTFGDVFVNLDQTYMVLAMTAAMMLIEIVVMASMYDKKTKMVTAGVSLAVLFVSIYCVRGQIGISDREFLKSMISHHGAAVLMCEKAPLEDLEVKALCGDILTSQRSQIEWMKEKLAH